MKTIFIKIGGSLITDKTQEKSFRQQTAERIAQELKRVVDSDSKLRLLVGHGSGSFGHFAAQHHNTMQGVATPAQWYGFAEVATVAGELSYLVTKVFTEAGLPIWRIQPSASAVCADGVITTMSTEPIQTALRQNIIPLVHGDVALDTVRGGTIISTETVFTYLAHTLPVDQILLLGEVEGVYDQERNVISEITPHNFDAIAPALGKSRGADVTGGMYSKVHDMLQLVQSVQGLTINIVDGTQPDLLFEVLTTSKQTGTHIHANY